MDSVIDAFLLTRQWRDTRDGVELVFWASSDTGPVRIQIDGQSAVFFLEQGTRAPELAEATRRPLEMRTLDGSPVDGAYFPTQRALVEARRALGSRSERLFESDLKPSDRFLMERFVTGGLRAEGTVVSRDSYRELTNPRISSSDYRPELSYVSLDIETEDFDGALYSIAATGPHGVRALLLDNLRWTEEARGALGGIEDAELSIHADENELLTAFFSFLNLLDPDVLIGWNLVEFDLRFIERRCRRLGLPFALGRAGEAATLLSPSGPGQKWLPRLPGRVALDGIDTLKNATWTFEDFSLSAVARELLGRDKLIAGEESRLEEIRRQYREDPAGLLAYNVEDCRLVEAIFERTNLFGFALERAALTGLAIDRLGGSVAAFDNLYLPRLHRKGFVAPNVGDHPEGEMSPGGWVMDSDPGLYDNVLVLDFKSLYPSIIRTFHVDPLALAAAGDDAVPGFRDARFSREEFILPELIENLWRARDEAKRRNDSALSRAIKILMNSFYGVLGTTGCRFFDPRLASSITLRGHEILKRSRKRLEDEGHTVIYGDTDSLFVLVGDGHDETSCHRLGSTLADLLSAYWRDELRETLRLDSCLEVEFETLYLRFFMPTIRNSEAGSKKRYAGLVRRDGTVDVEFTGLETVRSDWTALSREFQRELFRRVLTDEPFEDYVQRTVDELMSGERDHQLVYRKRLRRNLEDYKKNVPPHAQAARKSKRPGRWVCYVVTINGPEPLDNHPSRPDYEHYRDRQLAPVADPLLRLKGTSVKKIVDAQLSLF